MVHNVGFDYANCNGVYPMDKDRWFKPILEKLGYSTSMHARVLHMQPLH